MAHHSTAYFVFGSLRERDSRSWWAGARCRELVPPYANLLGDLAGVAAGRVVAAAIAV